MKESKLYCCFSVPQRDYLTSNGIKYELCGLNPIRITVELQLCLVVHYGKIFVMV